MQIPWVRMRELNQGHQWWWELVVILCWIYKEEKKSVKMQVFDIKLKIIRGSNNILVIIFIYISRTIFNSESIKHYTRSNLYAI
jgi:hypothetical protein